MTDENPFENLSDDELQARQAAAHTLLGTLREQMKKLKEQLPAASVEVEQIEREAQRRAHRDEWARKQVQFEQDRQDPEWQAWRREFLARARAAEPSVLDLPWSGVNLVHQDVSLVDLNLFLGPIHPEEKFIRFEDHWTMAHVAVEVGLFQSLTQARKNGFNKPIPSGFSQHVMGKGKTQVAILNRYFGMIPRSMSWVYQGVSYTYGNGFYTAYYPDKTWSVSFNGVHFVNGRVVRVKKTS